MNFRNINKFNDVVNTLSGNFYPLNHENTSLGFVCTTYMILTWFAELIYFSTTTIGLVFHESVVVALQASGVNTLAGLETLAVTVYMNSQRKYLRNLIRKFNGIIVDSKDRKQLIHETVEPTMKRLKIYTIASISSVMLWTAKPIVKVLTTDQFTYTDFSAPTYLPGAPFTVTIFVIGLLVEIIGAGYLIFKKISTEVYISYFITLLTSEYQYVNEQITNALCQENNIKEEKSVLVELQKCVRHHSVVIEYAYSSKFLIFFYNIFLMLLIVLFRIGQMLTELLSVNIGLTYLNCILRFCILGFSLVTISGAYFEKCLLLLYSMGNLIQVYILCSCIQELLEASTSITDDAFHENWHGRGSAVKTIFHTIALSNQIECRLTAFRIVDLTVPTFGSILHQAYSACLLLLSIN